MERAAGREQGREEGDGLGFGRSGAGGAGGWPASIARSRGRWMV